MAYGKIVRGDETYYVVSRKTGCALVKFVEDSLDPTVVATAPTLEPIFAAGRLLLNLTSEEEKGIREFMGAGPIMNGGLICGQTK